MPVDPISLSLLVAAVGFLVAAFRRDLAWGRRSSPEVRWMLAATLIALVALVSPVDTAASRSTAWHMVQHVLLVAAVGPLIVLSRPLEIMPWLLPPGLRRRLLAVARSLHRELRRRPAWCFVAAALEVATIWTFHIPVVYDAAVSSEVMHGLEHVTLVATSFLLWWSLIGARRRAGYGMAILAVFAVALASIALGALLVFARRPLYHLPAATSGPTQLLVDQQVAGVMMWAYGGLLTAASGLALFVVWMRDAERRSSLHDRIGDGHGTPPLAPTPTPSSVSAVGAADDHRAVRLRSVFIAAPLLAAATMFTVGLSDNAPTAAPTVDGASTGSSIYRRDCAECHGADGTGTSNAPSIADAGAAYVDYVVSSGRMPIERPDDPVERGTPRYDRETTVALAEYAGSLGDHAGPGIPDADLATADVANGGELYRLNCAACHQSVGAGGALVERAAPPLGSATGTQTMEAIRVGPFEMPAFGEAALSDDEVRDVAAYVTAVIQDPEDRGGWAIWHLGPVPEGAVAIIVGLGFLVLVSRWIERPSRPHPRSDE